MCNDVLLPALAPSPSPHLRVFIKDLAISFVICFSGLELPFFSSVLFPVLFVFPLLFRCSGVLWHRLVPSQKDGAHPKLIILAPGPWLAMVAAGPVALAVRGFRVGWHVLTSSHMSLTHLTGPLLLVSNSLRVSLADLELDQAASF
jgi:hypothetical protein